MHKTKFAPVPPQSSRFDHRPWCVTLQWGRRYFAVKGLYQEHNISVCWCLLFPSFSILEAVPMVILFWTTMNKGSGKNVVDQPPLLAPQSSLLGMNRARNHGGYDFQDPSSNPHRVTLKLVIPGQNYLLLVLHCHGWGKWCLSQRLLMRNKTSDIYIALSSPSAMSVPGAQLRFSGIEVLLPTEPTFWPCKVYLKLPSCSGQVH